MGRGEEEGRRPPVSERIAREELERGRREPDSPPAEPRPAATVVLARPSVSGFEVLLLLRPATSAFAAGAYVFPGGTVDPGDADPGLVERLPAGLREEGPALVAGLRELLEETGLLLADDPPPAAEVRRARGDLLAGRRGFGGIVRALEVEFRRLRATYLARWVTPEPLARRYDARFFLAEGAPPGWVPELTGELVGHVWLSPSEAVARFRAEELPMLFPTRSTLEALAPCPTLDAVREAWRGRKVEAVRPRLLVRGDSVRPVLPGEPGFDVAQ